MSKSSPRKSFISAVCSSEKAQRQKLPPPYSIRFTHEERARLDREAGKMPLSRYIRLKLFGADADQVKSRRPRVKRHQPNLDQQALGRVLAGLGASRLASNLNQIAKAAHMGALPVTPELEADLREACEALQDMREDLITAMGIKSR